MCIIESMSDDGMVWRGLGKGGEVVGTYVGCLSLGSVGKGPVLA